MTGTAKAVITTIAAASAGLVIVGLTWQAVGHLLQDPDHRVHRYPGAGGFT